MSDWPTVEFQSLAADAKSAFSKPYGSAITKEDYVPQGVPVVRGVNLRNGIFLDDEFVFISEQKANQMPGANLAPGDLVFTHRGTIGQVSMIPRTPRYPRYVLSTSQVKARLNPERAFPEFYYYWFTSSYGQHELLRNVSTVGVPGLGQPVATIKSLRVPRPPLPVQRAIAAVLGPLDRKIAANYRITETCDRLRSVSFQSWMQENPSAIDVRPLSSLAEFVNGRAFTKNASGTGRMVIRIAELNSGPALSTVFNDIEVSNEHLARPGDVLFAWSGSLTVKRWFRSEGIINQHIFKVVPTAGTPPWLIFELIRGKLTAFQGIAADKATTMGHIQRRHLDELVAVPVMHNVAKLDAALGPLWRRALAAEQEALALARLRDTLQPNLMSEKIRAREADKIIEGAR
jgi:type I restriction enzyme, S subunit